jgi:DNA adenine methylase
MPFYSPLRYPGGKSKLFPYIREIIKQNNFFNHTYVEPFSGGASVGLGLLINEIVPQIIINDLDIHIYSFWKSILENTERFISDIENIKLDIETWDSMKLIYKSPHEYSIYEVGLSTFYLNRTNKSGILTGGIIGGREQTGKYKIDARFNRDTLINRILKISNYQDRISVLNLDVIDLVNLIEDRGNPYFYYFDPPYYHKAKDLYLNHFQYSDHLELSEIIRSIEKNPFVLTYDNVKDIRQLYRDLYCDEFSLKYNAHNCTIGKEIIYYKNLLVPSIETKNKYIEMNRTA